MLKYLTFLFGASLLALGFPSAFEEYQKRLAAETQVEALDSPSAAVKASLPVDAPAARSGRVVLDAGPDGHFRTEARLNGRPVVVLVDTGATYVAMNEATARRLGVRVGPSDFRYESQTANGTTAVALARLDRVRIGAVEVRDVDVAVTRGDALDTVLLGMSFLRKLTRFEATGDKLSLIR